MKTPEKLLEQVKTSYINISGFDSPKNDYKKLSKKRK